MAGIYLHIPFCKQACHYCNFHFSTSLKGKNGFLEALLKEIELQKSYLQNETVNSIYFGGGTPSLLTADEAQQILQDLYRQFSIASNAEVTLEANPDDINAEKLAAWRMAGINRLSIGVQSFFEADLQWMNRAHSAKQAIECIQLSQDAGFSNLTIDLIYGSAGLSDEHWQQNVEQAIHFQIPHLSCYALTVETGTALDSLIKKNKSPAVHPEDQARQFVLLMDWMKAAGYEHYEISNFALTGKRSQHNSSYWQGKKYLGLGPSAHSFDGQNRQWNISNNALYVQSIQNNQVPFEREVLSETQQLNEYIMTSLRTMEGLNIQYVRERFGANAENKVRTAGQKFIDTGKLFEQREQWQLTNEGKLFADGIAADLFVVE
jgi:oxygen-independent coproporphyrinogen III oxidase